jgi:hypothetical protein
MRWPRCTAGVAIAVLTVAVGPLAVGMPAPWASPGLPGLAAHDLDRPPSAATEPYTTLETIEHPHTRLRIGNPHVPNDGEPYTPVYVVNHVGRPISVLAASTD